MTRSLPVSEREWLVAVDGSVHVIRFTRMSRFEVRVSVRHSAAPSIRQSIVTSKPGSTSCPLFV